MSRLSEVPYERVVEMEDFIRRRTHGDKACENAVRLYMGRAHAEAVSRRDSKIAFSLLLEAIDVVWNLRHSLAPTVMAPDLYHGRLWVHSDKFPGHMKAGPWTIEQWVPDQQAAEEAAADYLKHPWMSDGHLDWCLVDALTRREIVGYEEAVAGILPKPWTTGWVLQKLFAVWTPWLIEAGIAAGSVAWLRAEFASPEESPYRWWWAMVIGAYYAWWVGRLVFRFPAMVRARRARRKAFDDLGHRLQAMHRCYAELSGPVLDPTRVRDALLAAEKLDVRWSKATWPLLEGAIARDPHRWLTTLG